MTQPFADETRAEVAAALHQAARLRQPVDPPSTYWPLTIEDAYAIQQENVARRLRGGATLLGHKVGLTSEAIQRWLKVNEPDFGALLDDMIVPDGGLVAPARMMQPRAEGELAFVLGRDLTGPGCTAADALRATALIFPSIEIIDSRIKDWKLTLEDTVADNASSGLFVLGSTPLDPRALDLRLVGMSLRRRGRVVSTGAGAACLGNPAEAVAWLANKLAAFGQTLQEGQIILSGALGPAVPVAPGDWFEVQIGPLARASFRVSPEEHP